MGKVFIQSHLTVDFKGDANLEAYWLQRDTSVATFTTLQEELFRSLHGSKDAGEPGSSERNSDFDKMEASDPFFTMLDTVIEAGDDTHLPASEDVVGTANAALTTYNGSDFGTLQFKDLDPGRRPDCIKYIRREGRLIIEYNYDLELKTGVDAPAAMAAMATFGVTPHYRLILLMQRIVKP